MPDIDAYRAKLDAILASVDRLSDAQLRAAVAALNDARSAIIDRLVAAAKGGNTYSATVLTSLIADMQRIAAEYERRLGQSMEGALRRAWNLGAATLPDAWDAAGIGETFRIGLDTRLLDIASQLTADLVRDVSQNFITTVSREIRMGALGALSVNETIRRVRALLSTQPDRITARFGPILSQAERIVRTEIMRAYSLANEARLRQASEMVPGLRKYWLATPDARTRDTHIAAWHRYQPGGSVGPIPVKDDFIVGGFPAAYPYDPRLPARESINCRCRSATWHPDWFSKEEAA